MKEIDVADELESFLWSILFIAVRFLRTNFSPKDVDNFIERLCKFTLRPQYCTCEMSQLKQQALRRGEFYSSFRHVFTGHDAQGDSVDTPMNTFFDEYLHLCHAAYVARRCGPAWALYPRPRPRQNDKREDAGAGKIQARELAKKLEDHSAVLELIDRTVGMDWPRDEHAGDQWVMYQKAQREKEKKEQEEKEREEKEKEREEMEREEKEKEDVAAAEENAMGGRLGQEKRVRKVAAKDNSRRAVSKRNKRTAAGSKSRALVASRKINDPAQKEPPQQQEDDNPLKRRRNPVRSTRQAQNRPPEEPPTKRRRRC